jgi:coenzyme PQQ precursor peptide PqqA
MTMHLPSTAERITMSWTKPEAEIVAVTMEVTAYVATL